MDVRPVGSGPAGTDLTQGAGAANPTQQIGATTQTKVGEAGPTLDAAILSGLSEPDLARLLTILEPQPQNVSQVSALLQAVLTAAAAGDVERALAGVSQIAGLDPLQVEAIRNEPGLEPLRTQVDSLLGRLTTIARLDAQSRIAHATQVIEESGTTRLPDWDAVPQTLFLLASRLLESGGYVNALRAAQVAQVVVDGSHWAPTAGPVPAPGVPEVRESEAGWPAQGAILPALKQSWRSARSRAPRQVARLWRRAPLLVLLVAWLAAGTAGGLILRVQQTVRPGAWPAWISDAGVMVWAVGFLGLVLFGFYMRVRNLRL